MGQYLLLGICYQIEINKKANVTIEQVKQKLGEQVDLSLYDGQETDGEFIFVIKEAIVLEQLHDFLQQQFSIYPRSNKEDYKAVLKAIADLNSLTKIIELAEEIEFENFQQVRIDDYMDYDRTDGLYNRRDRLRIGMSLFVYIIEGKIFMESSDNFLKYMENLVKSNSKHAIVGAFRAFIQ